MKIILKLKAAREILMEFTEVILLMVKGKAMVHSNGIMDKSSKAIGNRVLSLDLVYGDHQKETVIKVSGLTIGNTVKESLSTRIVHIRDNFKIF